MNYHDEILLKIELLNPLHAQKLRDNTSCLGDVYLARANDFYGQYNRFLSDNGYTFNFVVDCYLRMLDDMAHERIEFIRLGRYSSSTFKEIDKCYYSKSEVMCYHMHGLALAQFLWFDQYERFAFFTEMLLKHKSHLSSYLEIGGGHGLYCYEALKMLSQSASIEMIDISAYSIRLGKGIINNPRVNFLQKNVFDYSSDSTFDFVTLGEVLEHVENPLQLLIKLRKLIRNSGFAFISTPVNAPMIDHIYLFKDVQQIRDIINRAGLRIVEEKVVISEHVSQQYAEKFKIPVMFAAIINQKQ